MLSGPHRKFAEGIATGLNQTQAYKAAYPDASAATARRAASALMTNHDIAAEVDRIRAAAQDKPEGATLTLARKLDFLQKVVDAPPSAAGPHNPLCELKMSKAGPYYAFPDKLRAAELHAKLSGELKDTLKHEGALEFVVNIGAEPEKSA